MVRTLTCIECPVGCNIEVELLDGAVVSVNGNNCKRGDMYARNEVTCPRRVVASSVRAKDGAMVSVKTDRPIRKSEIFAIMDKINAVLLDKSVFIGDIIVKGIDEDVNLVATIDHELNE